MIWVSVGSEYFLRVWSTCTIVYHAVRWIKPKDDRRKWKFLYNCLPWVKLESEQQKRSNIWCSVLPVQMRNGWHWIIFYLLRYYILATETVHVLHTVRSMCWVDLYIAGEGNRNGPSTTLGSGDHQSTSTSISTTMTTAAWMMSTSLPTSSQGVVHGVIMSASVATPAASDATTSALGETVTQTRRPSDQTGITWDSEETNQTSRVVAMRKREPIMCVLDVALSW